MKRFIEGEHRNQVTLLPECLDDYIGEDNPVRGSPLRSLTRATRQSTPLASAYAPQTRPISAFPHNLGQIRSFLRAAHFSKLKPYRSSA